MNRRWNDTRLRVWLRDPWNQTHLLIFGVILPAVALIWIWRVV